MTKTARDHRILEALRRKSQDASIPDAERQLFAAKADQVWQRLMASGGYSEPHARPPARPLKPSETKRPYEMPTTVGTFRRTPMPGSIKPLTAEEQWEMLPPIFKFGAVVTVAPALIGVLLYVFDKMGLQ